MVEVEFPDLSQTVYEARLLSLYVANSAGGIGRTPSMWSAESHGRVAAAVEWFAESAGAARGAVLARAQAIRERRADDGALEYVLAHIDHETVAETLGYMEAVCVDALSNARGGYVHGGVDAMRRAPTTTTRTAASGRRRAAANIRASA